MSWTCFAQEVKVETVLSGLHRPSGVAIRPGREGEPYEVFVAESGAQRVIKTRSDRPGESSVVIQGFDAGAENGDPLRSGSPLGLFFLDRERLVVGSGGRLPDVRLFALSAAREPLSADQMKQRISLPAPPEVAELPYGGSYAFARTRANDQVPDLLLVVIVGDHRISGLWKIRVRAGTLGEMNRFADEKNEDTTSVTAAVGVSEQGFTVLAQSDAQGASVLKFQSPIGAATVMQLPTELRKIVGLTYSTSSASLFAVDVSTAAPAEGGLFRLDDAGQPGRPAVKAVRIQSIRTPTALACGPEGALYVTAWNDADGRADQGLLLRFTGDL
jgi:hypothetical protein